MPAAKTPWRRRTRQSADVATLVRVGTLRKKNVIDDKVVQTIPVNNGTWPFTEQETTWDQIHKGPPYRSGGPFANVKAKCDLGIHGSGIHKSSFITGGTQYWEYQGGFARPFLSYESPRLASMKSLAVEDPYEDGLLVSESALGSEAYDRLRPNLSHADASVFLYELKDTARMLQTSSAFFKNIYRVHAPTGTVTRDYLVSGDWIKNYYASLRRTTFKGKNVSDNYLNHVFGWVPFVNDILKINEAYQNQRKYIDQITKDNGSWIRRVRTISSDHDEEVIHSGYTQGIAWRPEFDLMSSDMEPGTYSRYRLEQRSIKHTRVWAAGSFTYYRPEFDSSLTDYESNWNTAMRLLTLYGVRMNPYILWKVTPWTWLIDWFLNIGTMISRAVSWSTDGVVSRYMYLMKHTMDAVNHTVSVNWNNGLSTFNWLNIIESKQREVADNNFSFRLSGALSSRQLAILAALGLSRRRH